MQPDGGPVVGRTGDGDLELAGQEREFRMEGGPLADDLAGDARILDLVGGGAGILIGGGVADAVAAGLDGVHLDFRQVLQDVGDVFQLGPVVLDVLARGEVAVSLVVAARDIGQLAHLRRRQHAVRDGHAQHVGVNLQVKPVHQAERPEFLFGQLPGEPALDLAAELAGAFRNQRPVVFIVTVH